MITIEPDCSCSIKHPFKDQISFHRDSPSYQPIDTSELGDSSYITQSPTDSYSEISSFSPSFSLDDSHYSSSCKTSPNIPQGSISFGSFDFQSLSGLIDRSQTSSEFCPLKQQVFHGYITNKFRGLTSSVMSAFVAEDRIGSRVAEFKRPRVVPTNSQELVLTWYIHFYTYNCSLLALIRYLFPQLPHESNQEYQRRIIGCEKKQKSLFYGWKYRGLPRSLRHFAQAYALSIGLHPRNVSDLCEGSMTRKGTSK
ncbi:hypothetical protein ADUPG1_010434 [Aduncisulcus paluster]|uniref:Uncharacterized protein n=1 Tax=Aduncisulcus paluster TaxID=2918883 RepID=A0ABQ5JRD7_9EUKA|nr:hypothetical protein ADUPG1_010434 [Aduncisulcus paluster]|eukprot:gnl/Carplike_NY0171/541_a742_2235.p1 GENE.gnl/Carplike_NY0171/541_a742_2235~~gnl/Carplike_NY0171/541_a742_2235.p1  ORF type:complete len:254 (+),score=25.93 gnl/Carplike_NY0171/541_a742_2235:528-1289(+)